MPEEIRSGSITLLLGTVGKKSLSGSFRTNDSLPRDTGVSAPDIDWSRGLSTTLGGSWRLLTALDVLRRLPTRQKGSLDTLELGMAAASHTICWLTLHLLLAAGVTSFLISVVRFVSSILHQFILLLCSDLYLNRHSLNTFSTRAPFFSLTPSFFPTFSLAHLYMWLAFSCVHIDLRYAPLARSQASPEIRR